LESGKFWPTPRAVFQALGCMHHESVIYSDVSNLTPLIALR
jgi:hypothetical protein